MKKTDLKTLAAKLDEQCLEMEKTVRALAIAAKESSSHELKFRVLTEISSAYFGLNGLPTKIEKLREALDKIEEESLQEKVNP